MIDILAIVAGFVGVVACTTWALSSIEKKRQKALREIAQGLDMQFSATADEDLLSKLQSCSLFTKGGHRKAKNVMAAHGDSARTSIFDYEYTIGGGQDAQTHRHTVLAIEPSTMRAPAFTLEPAGLFAKLSKVFGSRPISFDDDPGFGRLFRLTSEEEDAVRAFFTAEVRELCKHRPGVTVAIADGVFFFYRGPKRERPEDIRALVSDGLDVYALLKL